MEEETHQKVNDLIKIGIIGVGAMGRSLAKIIDSYPNIKVTAFHDIDTRANIVSSHLFPDAVSHDSVDALMEEDIQWVLISTWNCFHASQAIAALNAGKHVFCQKPLAISIQQCMDILNAWKGTGLRFIMGLNLRYSPHFRKIKEVVSLGRIGKVISIEFNDVLEWNHGGFIMGNWRRLKENSGGHMLEKCCHDIDIVNWILDSRPKSAASFGGRGFFVPENESEVDRIGETLDGRVPYSTWPGIKENPFTSEKDILDNQVVILEYENNVRATFHTNLNSSFPEHKLNIFGSRGTLRSDLHQGSIEIKQIGFHESSESVHTGSRGPHGGGDSVLVKELVESIQSNQEASTNLLDGITSSIACLAIDQAQSSRKVVDLSPLWKELDESGGF